MFQLAELLTDRLANHLSIHIPYASEIQIKRIELFVIRAISIDVPGYRVCMRLSTAHGYGWSETFIEKKEKPSDWVHWSSCLVHYINTGSEFTREGSTLDSRLRQMFLTAIERVGSHLLQTAAAAGAIRVESAVDDDAVTITAAHAAAVTDTAADTDISAGTAGGSAEEQTNDGAADSLAAAARESTSELFTEDITLLARSECYISLF